MDRRGRMPVPAENRDTLGAFAMTCSFDPDNEQMVNHGKGRRAHR